MRVLVLDAEQKSALASIRSLATHGAEVWAGSHRRVTRGTVSANSQRFLRLPNVADEPAFVQSLVAALRDTPFDVVLPIGDSSNRVLSKNKAACVPYAAVPVVDWNAMQIASSKKLSMAFAQDVGVPVPLTFATKGEVDRYPIVVKHSLEAGRVRYVNTPQELAMVDVRDSVIQEYVPGDGFGFFALFDRGVARATFMHHRLREYPVTGGASTAAVSYIDDALQAAGLRLLEALEWHGVAMVEFKRDARDGIYRLMEINPKFWGSLDLAIAAGVDFPWLATRMALGDVDWGPPEFRSGVRFQWVFDDLLHLLARPRDARKFMHDLRTAENDLRASDPLPAAYDLARLASTVARRLAHGRLRHPHGAAIVAPAELRQPQSVSR